MESSKIEQFLEGKTIFITGATGFLAKLLVEKILRIQPNVKKLFLLLRGSDIKSTRIRFKEEILQAELFNVLREKLGAKLNNLIEEKVFPVAGDVSFEDFGIENMEMKDNMFKEIDTIIHSAASTRFDERYDIAVKTNVQGAVNVLKFAKRCAKLKILVHVSTAYVCGEGEGVIAEKSFRLGETLNKDLYLDIDVEKKVIEDKLKELGAQNLTSNEVTMTMRDLGIQRTVDSFFLAYGKGISNFFLGDPNTNVDLIPGDMVVNSILAAIVAHANIESSQEFIYHISSSKGNPLKLVNIPLFLLHYFTKNPWIDKDGNIIKVKEMTTFSSMDSFRAYISRYYWPLLKILELANLFSWYYLIDGTYQNLKRKIDKAIRLSELYRPYLIFLGSFDDVNTERLREATKECNMDDVLNFDPRCISWEDYFINIHLPGVMKRLA